MKTIHHSQNCLRKPTISIVISFAIILFAMHSANAQPVLKVQGSFPIGENNINACYLNIPSGPTIEEIAALYNPSSTCTEVIVNKQTTSISGNDANWSITYTYTISDCSNITLSESITYSGKDNNSPYLTSPTAAYTGQSNLNACIETAETVSVFNPELAKQGYTDDCGPVVVEFLNAQKTGTSSGWTITYNYLVKDNAGNPIPASYSNTGKDQTPPTLTGTLYGGSIDENSCFANAQTNFPFNAALVSERFSDNCGGSITAELSKPLQKTGNDSGWIITYYYKVKDAAGNYSSEYSYTVSGSDKTAPVFSGTTYNIPDFVNACIDNAVASSPAFSSTDALRGFTNPCGGSLIINETTSTVTGTDTDWVLTYHYTVTNQAGNSTNGTYTVKGGDRTAPSLTTTAYTSVFTNACYSNAYTAVPFSETKALTGYTDNCGGAITATQTNYTITGNNTNWTITYTYTVIDLAGNQLTGRTYTEAGGDRTAPSLTTAPYTSSFVNTCKNNAIASAPFTQANAIIGYSDLCGGALTATLTNTDITGDDQNWTITYTYTVSDQAGNPLPGRTYTVNGGDRTAPLLTGTKYPGLSNVNALKSDALTQASFVEANAILGYTDNCGGSVFATLDNYSLEGTDCSWTLKYTYTIMDMWGNPLLNQSYTNTGGIKSVVSVAGPADFSTHACTYTTETAYNNAFNTWKAQFKVIDAGYGGTPTNISNINPPSLCGGGTVTIKYDYSDGCSSATVSATFTITPCYTTVKAGNWHDATVWQNGCMPSHRGGLPNKTVININHDVNLIDYCYKQGNSTICVDGSFQSVQGTNFLDIYVNDGATWFIQRDVDILRNMSLYIEYNSNIQIGTEPPPCYTSFCEPVPAGCTYTKSKFSVYGSAQGSTDNPPGIYIREEGAFQLYGDIYVENNFDIVVAPGGEFIVEGGFVAGNKAEVAFYGEDESGSIGSIGCDMDFTNSGTIYMVGATLDVGGDMTFGNASDIYLVGSTVNVKGEICSGSGIGDGAIITIHNGYWEDGQYIPVTGDEESSVNAGFFCASVKNPDNVTLPVELLYFTSTVNIDNIQLDWSTASELNNNYFTIEKSANLIDWETAGYVTGAGTVNEIRNYTFEDHDPIPGISYYRLKQTDFDGAFEYFDPVAVQFEATTELDFTVLKYGSQWSVEVPTQESFHLEVYTLTGRKLHSEEGNHSIQFPNPEATVVIKVVSGTDRASRVIM